MCGDFTPGILRCEQLNVNVIKQFKMFTVHAHGILKLSTKGIYLFRRACPTICA